MTGADDWVRKSFADQFEPDAQGFLYRKYMKGAPIRVSTAEHDRYIATFNRYTRYASWSIFGGTILLILCLVVYATAVGVNLSDTAVFMGVGVILLASIVGYYWIWNLPVRELCGRPTEGEARSRAEVRRLLLEKTTYSQIVAIGGAGIAFLIKAYSSGSMFSGRNIFWTSSAAIALILSAVQAFRKWRFESRQR